MEDVFSTQTVRVERRFVLQDLALEDEPLSLRCGADERFGEPFELGDAHRRPHAHWVHRILQVLQVHREFLITILILRGICRSRG
jgi:hypothetical protein